MTEVSEKMLESIRNTLVDSAKVLREDGNYFLGERCNIQANNLTSLLPPKTVTVGSFVITRVPGVEDRLFQIDFALFGGSALATDLGIIATLKFVRAITGCDLKTAKHMIDSLA
jgi:hypothetical protein